MICIAGKQGNFRKKEKEGKGETIGPASFLEQGEVEIKIVPSGGKGKKAREGKIVPLDVRGAGHHI